MQAKFSFLLFLAFCLFYNAFYSKYATNNTNSGPDKLAAMLQNLYLIKIWLRFCQYISWQIPARIPYEDTFIRFSVCFHIGNGYFYTLPN